MLSAAQSQISISIAHMRILILVWHIPKSVDAATDANPAKMIAAGQSFAEAFAAGIYQQARRAAYEAHHWRRSGFAADLEII